MERGWLTRRTFLVGVSVLAAVAGADRRFLEPRDLVAEHIDIQLQRLPEELRGFRIAQISDVHFGPYLGRAGLERAVHLAQSFRPDLLALTGDFVSHPFGRSNGRAGALHAEPCANVLAMVTGIPVVAVLGNHDHWNHARIVDGALTARGITVLRNRAIPLSAATAVSGSAESMMRSPARRTWARRFAPSRHQKPRSCSPPNRTSPTTPPASRLICNFPGTLMAVRSECRASGRWCYPPWRKNIPSA
jgi:predicted MPP superfamily phosphohydrolase